jgi:hypothetical protein
MDTTTPIFSKNDSLKFFRTLNSRVNNYFINLMGEYFAEVISGSWKSNGNYIDEKSVAQVLYNTLLGSPAHKKILDSIKSVPIEIND